MPSEISDPGDFDRRRAAAGPSLAQLRSSHDNRRCKCPACLGDFAAGVSYRDDTYLKAFDIMSQVTPRKMLALCECAGIPDPDKMAKDGPRWLFCIPWAAKAEPHPP